MDTEQNSQQIFHTICIGAGSAGLTAGYLLSKKKLSVMVLEKDSEYVGGISRTVRYKGFGFDIGGHRFFSKSRQVVDLWEEVLGGDFLERPRKSRIFYGRKLYPYPLEPFTTLRNLGIFESMRCVLSYIIAKLQPRVNPKSFEDWVINHFGARLYNIFFKTYTEKVWGMSCREISADWAAQRIKGLSLYSAVRAALFPPRGEKDPSKIIKTLIATFRYPRQGPGMMWEKMARLIQENKGQVQLGRGVRALEYNQATGLWKVEAEAADGATSTYYAQHVISSMPLRELVNIISPKLPEAAVKAANCLKYRDFLVVALILKDKGLFDDNWIYIHEPDVKVGRIQNFKSWSPELVPDPALNCYGMEYFCFEGDGLWNSADSDLSKLAVSELVKLGLADAADVQDACVVRQPKAYPVYDQEYHIHVDVIRQALAEHCPGLHLVGRAGMHKYNNQDHAMMTAMLTVENILTGRDEYDVWRVNQDAQYHEEAHGNDGASGERLVPSQAA